MAANSEIIFNSTSHPNNNNAVTVYGTKAKGAGYYGFGHSLHTVEFQFSGFIGGYKIQGTLASNPTDNDWIDVPLSEDSEFFIDTTGLISRITDHIVVNYEVATTSVKIYNFNGNFTWIRAVVEDWTAGSINRVLLNH
jgi:hypothetical protein